MFPIIKNISDILPVIKGRKEFIVVEKDDYKYVDYVYVENDSFNDPLRLECRGLIFDKETGNLLRRPLEKFMNYGEKDTYDTVDWSLPHIITDKRDGSMIAPFFTNGQLRLGTRAGVTEHSIKAEQHLTNRLRVSCETLIKKGYTPIFEWTAPENQIVLPYDESELTLLAIRHIETGDYLSTLTCQTWSHPMGVSFVDIIKDELSMDKILELRGQLTGVEGYVVFFPDTGLHIKIKTDEYTKAHRAVSFFERENTILPIVLDRKCDDLYPVLSEKNVARLQDYSQKVMEQVAEEVHDIKADILWLKTIFNNRKEQALWIQKTIDREFWSIYFNGLDNKDVTKSYKETVLKNPEILWTRW